mmetsp:Transcript_41157/g.106364  ORF Transcript_41157/g.106364 Transcript_41157/m.106364 type:complete len:234 (-) Transcript_41157:1474-2175(-)
MKLSQVGSTAIVAAVVALIVSLSIQLGNKTFSLPPSLHYTGEAASKSPCAELKGIRKSTNSDEALHGGAIEKTQLEESGANDRGNMERHEGKLTEIVELKGRLPGMIETSFSSFVCSGLQQEIIDVINGEMTNELDRLISVFHVARLERQRATGAVQHRVFPTAPKLANISMPHVLSFAKRCQLLLSFGGSFLSTCIPYPLGCCNLHFIRHSRIQCFTHIKAAQRKASCYLLQ